MWLARVVEFHILIDALDCPALGQPATVRATAGMVALTTANDVLELSGHDSDADFLNPLSSANEPPGVFQDLD